MIFRDLRGMDVEYLVNEVARDSSKLWGGTATVIVMVVSFFKKWYLSCTSSHEFHAILR